MTRASPSSTYPPSLWDLSLAAYTLILAVSLPMEQVAFHSGIDHLVLIYLRWFGYLLFGADFYLRLRRGEYHAHTQSKKWKWPDFIAALPVGPVGVLVAPEAPAWILVAAHSLPIIRLLRVYSLARHWQQAHPAQTAIRRIATTFAGIFLIVHWVGCWQIAVYKFSAESPLFLRYLQALYWTLTTMTTIGYGDITPDLTQPRALIFTMIVMALGAGVFGFIIGNIANIMSNLDFARNQHLDRMQRITTFMRYHNIPAPLRNQVHDYFSYLWSTRRGFKEADVLAELPDPIRREIEMHLRRDIVAKVPFFRGADPAFIQKIVAALKPRIALPGERIIQRGEIGDSMYFIASGGVEVLGPDDQTPVATLAEGSFFGEIALLERGPRNASVRAAAFCDLYTLDKASLDLIISHYPDFGRHISSMAEQRKGK